MLQKIEKGEETMGYTVAKKHRIPSFSAKNPCNQMMMIAFIITLGEIM